MCHDVWFVKVAGHVLQCVWSVRFAGHGHNVCAALLEQLNNLRRASPASSGFASPPPPEITPLTRQQLQQAMIHIIRVSTAVVCVSNELGKYHRCVVIFTGTTDV